MRVSIAIPFFNNAATLEVAIRSVFAQTLNDWELLLIDDGSCDGSLKIAQSVRDSRVRTFTDGENRGLVYRLNQAAGLARGELLARMDADDIMHPERLGVQSDYLDSHPNIHLTGSAAYIIDARNQPVGLRDAEERRSRTGWTFPMLIHPTVMGRTLWFRDNPYDSRYVRAEDVELWYRTRAHACVKNLRQPLLFYREAGCFNLWKYSQSAWTVCKILRRYGPALFGPAGTAKRCAASLLKCGVYGAFAACGQEHRLLRTRNRSLTKQEKEDADRTLAIVLNAQIPGMNEPPVCAVRAN